MAIIVHNVTQGSEEWLAARCGLLTASEVKNIITPSKLEFAENDKSRAHFYNLLAQRITKHVEPSFQGFDMMRGHEEEADALALYDEKYAMTDRVGFITNDKWGFTLGYSPDALVGDDGLVEVKSRCQKYHIETMLNHVRAQTCPSEFVLQIQAGLLVTQRDWCDFISYCGGLPMVVIRVYPDLKVIKAIIEAGQKLENMLSEAVQEYEALTKQHKFHATERRVYGEMT